MSLGPVTSKELPRTVTSKELSNKARLRYQSERVTYRSDSVKTITLPERRVAAGMQQDSLQHTLGVQDKLSAPLVRSPVLSDIMRGL